jgi:NAD(P)-dependent dehydrogenase (short-subunit alcohol dehydrogenase family)
MEFADKTAVVTGAGSGIGRATARALAREGAHVIVADIDPAGGEATAAAIRQQGQIYDVCRLDTDAARSRPPAAAAQSARSRPGQRRLAARRLSSRARLSSAGWQP